jgi:addiction module HigA family antidote
MKRISTHPGEILSKDVFPAAGLDAASASKILDVPQAYLQSVLDEKAPVTKELAAKLGAHFKNSPEFWENLQKAHDASATTVDGAKKRLDHFKKQRGPK